jgi:hypothetical protein
MMNLCQSHEFGHQDLFEDHAISMGEILIVADEKEFVDKD